MPPVAIGTGRPAATDRHGTTPVENLAGAQPQTTRGVLRRAKRVLGAQGVTVNVGPVKRRHVNLGSHVLGQHPPERGREPAGAQPPGRMTSRHRRSAVSRSTTFRNCSCSRAMLPAPHVSYNHTLNKAPAGYPSRSAGTRTKPSARVVLERIDAPLVASGSTDSPTSRTRA